MRPCDGEYLSFAARLDNARGVTSEGKVAQTHPQRAKAGGVRDFVRLGSRGRVGTSRSYRAITRPRVTRCFEFCGTSRAERMRSRSRALLPGFASV